MQLRSWSLVLQRRRSLDLNLRLLARHVVESTLFESKGRSVPLKGGCKINISWDDPSLDHGVDSKSNVFLCDGRCACKGIISELLGQDSGWSGDFLAHVSQGHGLSRSSYLSLRFLKLWINVRNAKFLLAIHFVLRILRIHNYICRILLFHH